ncbi:DUF2490 domain-containing protein [Chitinophaga sp. 22536]|uniref:DUF2490 domain-containing protein n=1 Tax=unclassified Chitinophaga TaxID=2619133 RepID=UPI003F8701D6
MYWIKRLLATAMWLSIVRISAAQDHYNAWLRGTLDIPLSEKIKTDIEFQHRRQNGFENTNMLDKSLMFSIRNWIHYQYDPNLKFSVSPFSYFSHYRVIRQKEDNGAPSLSEVRVSIAEELQHKIFPHMYLFNRNALEYRVFNNAKPNTTRFRTRFGGRYELTENFKLSAFDELFINVAGTSSERIPDHNRTGFNMEYSISPNLKFDIGYIYIVRSSSPSAAGNIKSCEHNMFLNLTYQLKNNK